MRRQAARRALGSGRAGRAGAAGVLLLGWSPAAQSGAPGAPGAVGHPSGVLDALIGLSGLELAVFALLLLVAVVVTWFFSSPRRGLGQAAAGGDCKYGDFFDKFGDAIYVTNRRGRIIDCNRPMLDLLGYTRAELLGLDFDQLYAHPGDRRTLDLVLERQGSVTDYEARLCRKDGTERDCLLSAAARQDDRGKVVGYVGMIRDVTAARRMERALRQGEEQYRTLFEKAPIGLGVADDEGNLLAFNDAMLDPGGYRREDIARLNSMANLYYDPEERDRVMALARREGQLRKHETRFRKRDGGYYDALLSLTPVRIGGQLGWLTMIEDISEQKRAEESLQRERLFSEMAVESVPGLFYLFDEDGRFLRWNENVERVSGYSAEELASMGPPDFFEGEDKRAIDEKFKQVLREGEASLEAEFVTKDGTAIPYFFTGTRVTFDDRPCVIGMGIDISGRKRLEEQFFLSQKLEAVGQLAGGVAHDFNNLLTAILGGCDLLLEHFEPEDERRVEVEEIASAGRRAASLTRQLLAFSRRQMMRPRVLDLNQVVLDIGSMLQRLIGEDIELVTVLEPELRSVKADPGQLEQVLVNLVVNARDAMPDGGRLTVRTANVDLEGTEARGRETVEPGPYVLVEVSDTGKGMDEATLARVFEPFFTTKEQGKGTGLGLSTAYGIVKQTAGYIWARSEPGRGTTFEVYLPAAAGPVERAKPAPESLPAAGGAETVLLVEDETAVRRVMRKELERQGYTVLEAASGDRAVELAERYPNPIHILITDVVMPHMSGRDLAERLGESRPEMKVLYVSGYADEFVVRQGVLEGTPFLQKPFANGALAAKVRELLDGVNASAVRPG